MLLEHRCAELPLVDVSYEARAPERRRAAALGLPHVKGRVRAMGLPHVKGRVRATIRAGFLRVRGRVRGRIRVGSRVRGRVRGRVWLGVGVGSE